MHTSSSFSSQADRDTRPVRRPQRQQVSHRVGFWFAAVGFTVLMAFGTAPTPLWPLYQARDGFGSTTTTVAFAMLVVGAAAGFLTLGHLSDRFGRRRIVVPALLVAIVAALELALWPDLPGLLIGRFLDGIGVGLMGSTATSYLHDLHHQEHPERQSSSLPGVISTAATLGGLALGPLAAGVLSQWGPSPLITTQMTFAVAMSVCLVLALATPETVDRNAQVRPSRFSLMPGGTAAFASGAALGFFSFAILGLISAMGASMLHSKLGIFSPFIAGLAPFLMFGCAAAGLVLFWRLSLFKMLASGAAVFPIGLALVSLSLVHPVLWLYLVACSIAGLGAGALFKGGIGTAGTVASPKSRAGVLAVFFVLSYAGMGLPPILFSMALQRWTIETTMIVFAIVLSVSAAVAVAAALLADIRNAHLAVHEDRL
ncbi:MFS transporter [Streptomyces sp. NE06-03E]|uniref:MFS transporter n=1 Tax=unclassified Streptomyces TaxID=2593676 RepID=UPI0029BA2F5E|nr:MULTISPECIES: MFS transporter [unclassified Streptomyces]MDX3054277.1 MFS transporter [Streptomyces sp. NE06-03E]